MGTEQPEFDVFLSYARKDNEKNQIIDFITRLREYIDANCASTLVTRRVYYDRQQISSGAADFVPKLRRALKSSRSMLVCLTRNYLYGGWTLKEFEAYKNFVRGKQNADSMFVLDFQGLLSIPTNKLAIDEETLSALKRFKVLLGRHGDPLKCYLDRDNGVASILHTEHLTFEQKDKAKDIYQQVANELCKWLVDLRSKQSASADTMQGEQTVASDADLSLGEPEITSRQPSVWIVRQDGNSTTSAAQKISQAFEPDGVPCIVLTARQFMESVAGGVQQSDTNEKSLYIHIAGQRIDMPSFNGVETALADLQVHKHEILRYCCAAKDDIRKEDEDEKEINAYIEALIKLEFDGWTKLEEGTIEEYVEKWNHMQRARGERRNGDQMGRSMLKQAKIFIGKVGGGEDKTCAEKVYDSINELQGQRQVALLPDLFDNLGGPDQIEIDKYADYEAVLVVWEHSDHSSVQSLITQFDKVRKNGKDRLKSLKLMGLYFHPNGEASKLRATLDGMEFCVEREKVGIYPDKVIRESILEINRWLCSSDSPSFTADPRSEMS